MILSGEGTPIPRYPNLTGGRLSLSVPLILLQSLSELLIMAFQFGKTVLATTLSITALVSGIAYTSGNSPAFAESSTPTPKPATKPSDKKSTDKKSTTTKPSDKKSTTTKPATSNNPTTPKKQ
ncbi:MAG: hypothetical protein RLZZ338_2479 [Cyanobacteriota bacterium]